MNAFRFPLQKALDWRGTQLELAEARLAQSLAALAAIDRAIQLDPTLTGLERLAIRLDQPPPNLPAKKTKP